MVGRNGGMTGGALAGFLSGPSADPFRSHVELRQRSSLEGTNDDNRAAGGFF